MVASRSDLEQGTRATGSDTEPPATRCSYCTIVAEAPGCFWVFAVRGLSTRLRLRRPYAGVSAMRPKRHGHMAIRAPAPVGAWPVGLGAFKLAFLRGVRKLERRCMYLATSMGHWRWQLPLPVSIRARASTSAPPISKFRHGPSDGPSRRIPESLLRNRPSTSRRPMMHMGVNLKSTEEPT